MARHPNQHQIYLAPDLQPYVGNVAVLKKNGAFSRRVMSMLARCAALYEVHGHEIRELFTTAELVAILAAIRGTAWTPATIVGGVIADVQDSEVHNLPGNGEGTAALIEKLRKLSSGQQVALLEVLSHDLGYDG